MSALDETIRKYPIPTVQPLAWAIMILTGLAIVWAWFAKLDTVAVATGEVVPQGQLKVVQHLEGGVIDRIYVREGDAVAAGEPVLQLDLKTSATNTDELRVRLDGLLLRRARLLAEANRADLELPDDVVAARPKMAEAERQSYDGRIANLDSRRRVLERQEQQRGLEINELKVRRQVISNDYDLAKENYDRTFPLLEKKLITKDAISTLERELERLRGEQRTIDASLPRARAALAEVREKLSNVGTEFQTEAATQLGEVELEIRRHEKLLERAESELGRMEIHSPIDGVVKTLIHNTVGGVIRPGEPIMEIVPTQERLVIEARIDPIDVGHIHPGMPAKVKFTTYDFIRYGALEGRIASVGADIETDQQTGQQYFKGIVETDSTFLDTGDATYDIFPGMQAMVDIHLGEKTVMDFLLQPVLKMRLEAFRER